MLSMMLPQNSPDPTPAIRRRCAYSTNSSPFGNKAISSNNGDSGGNTLRSLNAPTKKLFMSNGDRRLPIKQSSNSIQCSRNDKGTKSSVYGLVSPVAKKHLNQNGNSSNVRRPAMKSSANSNGNPASSQTSYNLFANSLSDFRECSKCVSYRNSSLDDWMDHLGKVHPLPSSWPSDRASSLDREDTDHPYTAVVDSHKKRKAHTIPRPLNSFMIFAQYIRRLVLQTFPDAPNVHISQRVGHLWRNMETDLRSEFSEEANRLQELHAIEFPGYKYRPRKRSRPVSLGLDVQSSHSLNNQRNDLHNPATSLTVNGDFANISNRFITDPSMIVTGNTNTATLYPSYIYTTNVKQTPLVKGNQYILGMDGNTIFDEYGKRMKTPITVNGVKSTTQNSKPKVIVDDRNNTKQQVLHVRLSNKLKVGGAKNGTGQSSRKQVLKSSNSTYKLVKNNVSVVDGELVGVPFDAPLTALVSNSDFVRATKEISDEISSNFSQRLAKTSQTKLKAPISMTRLISGGEITKVMEPLLVVTSMSELKDLEERGRLSFSTSTTSASPGLPNGNVVMSDVNNNSNSNQLNVYTPGGSSISPGSMLNGQASDPNQSSLIAADQTATNTSNYSACSSLQLPFQPLELTMTEGNDNDLDVKSNGGPHSTLSMPLSYRDNQSHGRHLSGSSTSGIGTISWNTDSLFVRTDSTFEGSDERVISSPPNDDPTSFLFKREEESPVSTVNDCVVFSDIVTAETNPSLDDLHSWSLFRPVPKDNQCGPQTSESSEIEQPRKTEELYSPAASLPAIESWMANNSHFVDDS